MANILITGGNRGIGLELARQLAARGDQVTVACRQKAPELAEFGVRIVEGVDVTSDHSVSELASALEGVQLDRLVNNAGILGRDSLDDLDFSSMEQQFRVNSIGPLRVTAALRSNLSTGSKVFIVTSRMGSIEDNSSGGYYGYRMSKAAVNIAGKSLSIDLKPDGIGVFQLHPGYVATDMTSHHGTPVEDSARGLIARMDELEMKQTGTFWHQEGYELPW
jgi:NAD(P)-dependent dehydrogenase (short-subunit alcohol dehydrogenase family)